jgi:predicted transcriptional regulator
LQELCSLLFELSNEDRLNILRGLKNNPMKLSRVSERFNFTVPETARNTTRLSEANLIVKDVDGYFHLTPFGEVALQLLPGFEFLSKHKKYFKTHTLSTFPLEYSMSIGALIDSKFVNEVTTTFYNFENMVREAKEFIWVLVDQILASALPIIADAVTRGVEFRKIMPRQADIDPNILAMTSNPVFERAARAKKLESRYLDRVDVAILLSENEVAAIAFQNLEGKFDYLSFRSKEESTLNWSKSLFSYYWDKAKR